LIDQFAADGSCEFVGQFAARSPTIFVAILGLPEEGPGKLERWNDLTHVYEDPGVRRPRRTSSATS
jgi:hypothetical protein